MSLALFSNKLSGSLTCLVYIIDTHSWMTTSTVSLTMCAVLTLLKGTPPPRIEPETFSSEELRATTALRMRRQFPVIVYSSSYVFTLIFILSNDQRPGIIFLQPIMSPVKNKDRGS